MKKASIILSSRETIRISSVFIILLFITSTPSLAEQYKVIRVVDGNTIVVNYQGKYEKLRFLCVNTPESVHHDKKQNIPMGILGSLPGILFSKSNY